MYNFNTSKIVQMLGISNFDNLKGRIRIIVAKQFSFLTRNNCFPFCAIFVSITQRYKYTNPCKTTRLMHKVVYFSQSVFIFVCVITDFFLVGPKLTQILT